MENFKVLKKDGSIVEFDPKKIYNACISAGASEDIAQIVLNKVIEDLYIISSERLREIALKNLRKLDSNVADNWIKYDIEHGQIKNDIILKL